MDTSCAFLLACVSESTHTHTHTHTGPLLRTSNEVPPTLIQGRDRSVWMKWKQLGLWGLEEEEEEEEEAHRCKEECTFLEFQNKNDLNTRGGLSLSVCHKAGVSLKLLRDSFHIEAWRIYLIKFCQAGVNHLPHWPRSCVEDSHQTRLESQLSQLSGSPLCCVDPVIYN